MTPRRPISATRSRSARARSAASACSSCRRRTSARRRRARTRRCDFRSGRVILQRPIERAQMQKLLATGKTDLLQFVSARTRRPFSAFLVRQPDGKIGFEFEAQDPAKAGARRGARGAPAALRVLGAHPKDGRPVELLAGRYGPYVKHGERQRDRARPRQGRFAHARRSARAPRREGGARRAAPREALGEDAAQGGAAKRRGTEESATRPSSGPAARSSPRRSPRRRQRRSRSPGPPRLAARPPRAKARAKSAKKR